MFSGVHSRKVYEIVKRAGTHRGHNKVFLAAPSTPSSASASLQFVRVTFSDPAFTAVTRVQIPSGTPTSSDTHFLVTIESRWNWEFPCLSPKTATG
jgi:hypothetical protein